MAAPSYGGPSPPAVPAVFWTLNFFYLKLKKVAPVVTANWIKLFLVLYALREKSNGEDRKRKN